MPDKHSNKQFLMLPYDIVQKCDTFFDAGVWGYIYGWENSTKKSAVTLRIGSIAEFFKVHEKTIYASLDRLQNLGLIGKSKTLNGTRLTTRVDRIESVNRPRKQSSVTPENGVSVTPKNGESKLQKMENRNSKKWSNLNTSNINTSGTINQSTSFLDQEIKSENPTSSNDDVVFSSREQPSPPLSLEPFESEPPAGYRKDQLTNMRGYEGPRRSSEFKIVTIPEKYHERIKDLMGIGAVDELEEFVTEDMLNAPGLIDGVLSKLGERKCRPGGVENPIGWFRKVLNSTWKDGNYLLVEQMKKDEEEASLNRVRERIRAAERRLQERKLAEQQARTGRPQNRYSSVL